MGELQIISATANTSAARTGSKGRLLDAYSITREVTGNTFLAVDNSNIMRGSLDRDFRVDLALVLERFGGDKVILATMSASAPLHERPSQAAFYGRLRRTGWRVNLFELQRDPAGRVRENEELVDGDVRSQIRAAARSNYCDTIVVLGGDGGYTNAVLEARRAGKTVIVLAWEGTLHPALAAAASAHASIDSLRDLIGRKLH